MSDEKSNEEEKSHREDKDAGRYWRDLRADAERVDEKYWREARRDLQYLFLLIASTVILFVLWLLFTKG